MAISQTMDIAQANATTGRIARRPTRKMAFRTTRLIHASSPETVDVRIFHDRYRTAEQFIMTPGQRPNAQHIDTKLRQHALAKPISGESVDQAPERNRSRSRGLSFVQANPEIPKNHLHRRYARYCTTQFCTNSLRCGPTIF